jgi:hypothetical protein
MHFQEKHGNTAKDKPTTYLLAHIKHNKVNQTFQLAVQLKTLKNLNVQVKEIICSFGQSFHSCEYCIEIILMPGLGPSLPFYNDLETQLRSVMTCQVLGSFHSSPLWIANFIFDLFFSKKLWFQFSFYFF